MPNPVYTYILNIYDLVGLVWVGFYGISTIIGYLMPNPIYTYIETVLTLAWIVWNRTVLTFNTTYTKLNCLN